MDKFPATLAIHRTNQNQFTTYRGDGFGRDSYITVGNAGQHK